MEEADLWPELVIGSHPTCEELNMLGFGRLYVTVQLLPSQCFIYTILQQARRAAKDTGAEQDADLRGGSRDEEECKQ